MDEGKAKGAAKSPHEKLQGFSTKGLAGDVSAALTKSIDSVTGGIICLTRLPCAVIAR